MQNDFTRAPRSETMVTETVTPDYVALLCIDCGWEGSTSVAGGEWIKFKQHACKLRTQSISTSD